MNLNFWPFNRAKRRHARYVLNINAVSLESTSQSLNDLLKRHTIVLSAGQFNKLPSNLKLLFVRAGK